MSISSRGACRLARAAASPVTTVWGRARRRAGRRRCCGGGSAGGGRAAAGRAGHNGLRSLAQTLGTQEFLRLRIGVGRPGRGDPRSVADYVLSPFELDEDVGALVSRAADAVETVAREGVEAAQQRFN